MLGSQSDHGVMETKGFTVMAIDPRRLERIRATDTDERGERLGHFPAQGWEPLRCCLKLPDPGEKVALLSYSPFPHTGHWAESGPVYIHSTSCGGYPDSAELPADFRTGPRILRSYRADGSLDYQHIRLIPDGVDLEGPIRRLFEHEEVTTIHVRALLTQCFTYRVDRQRPPNA
jgi:Protein of unknown function (DUF1203)